MEQKKSYLSLFLIMIISSFLIGGCYTQLERPGVQIDDEEDEYYDEIADSDDTDSEYEEYADDSADIQHNYYFYDSPYHYSYYPYYYRPISRFDALLYFDYYDAWLNYYTWWPVAGYSWWPAYSYHSYHHYDPWGFRARHYSPYWWDRHYYASGHGYVASHVPQKQRPFVGRGPVARTQPRIEKQRSDLQPISKKRFVRSDDSKIQQPAKRNSGTSYSRRKDRNDTAARKTPAPSVRSDKSRREETSTRQVTKSRSSTSSREKAPANARSGSSSSSKQRQSSATPSRSSSTPKRSAVQPTQRSSPPPQRSSNSGGSSSSSGSSKNSSKSSDSSKKKSK